MKLPPRIYFFVAALTLIPFGIDATAHPLDAASFAKRRELLPENDRLGEWGKFDLDADVFAHTEANFSDLRVIDDLGEEIPVTVWERTASKTTTRRAQTRAVVDSLKELTDGAIEVVVRRPEKLVGAIVGINLRTNVRDFEKSVVVEGSEDGNSWERLVGSAVIYDYHRFVEGVRSTAVKFPPSQFSRFRIRIDTAVDSENLPVIEKLRETRDGKVIISESERSTMRQRVFKMEGIELLQSIETSVSRGFVTELHEIEDLLVTLEQESRSTVATFVSRRIPLRALMLSTDAPYFDRAISVEGAGDSEDSEWVFLTKTRIVRKPRAEADSGNDPMEIDLGGGKRFSRFRVTIADGDSPPLEDVGFRVKGVGHEGIFFAKPERRYHLLYGASEIPAPKYDIERVLRSSNPVALDEFTLGEVEPNPGFLLGGAIKNEPVPGKAILTIVIIAVAVFLLVLIIRISKETLD